MERMLASFISNNSVDAFIFVTLAGSLVFALIVGAVFLLVVDREWRRLYPLTYKAMTGRNGSEK